MGNSIKNYEKKKRNEYSKEYKEMQKIVHNAMIDRINLPNNFKEKEKEVFNNIIK